MSASKNEEKVLIDSGYWQIICALNRLGYYIYFETSHSFTESVNVFMGKSGGKAVSVLGLRMDYANMGDVGAVARRWITYYETAVS